MEKPSFEQRLNSVREIAEKIENGEMPLEEAVRQFESGIRTLKGLEEDLAEMKHRVTVLQETADGAISERTLEDEA